MTVKIIPNDKGNPPGKRADVELHFDAADARLSVSPATASRRLNRGDVPPNETNLPDNDPTFAVDSLEMMKRLFQGRPLGFVSAGPCDSPRRRGQPPGCYPR